MHELAPVEYFPQWIFQPGTSWLTAPREILRFLSRIPFKFYCAIFIIILMENAIDQYISQKIQSYIASSEGFDPMLYPFVALSLASALLFPCGIFFLFCQTLKKLHRPVDVSDMKPARLFNQTLIETLRSWSSEMRWAFLMIVPGIIRWIQLSLVIPCVCFSATYSQGTVDALRESARISRGHLRRLALIHFVFLMAIPLVLAEYIDQAVLWRRPWLAVFAAILDSFLAIIFCLLLTRVYFIAKARGRSHDYAQ